MKFFVLHFLLLLSTFGALAQEATYNIPLSNPNKSGALKIDVYNAQIIVKGVDAKEVQLSIVDKRMFNKTRSAEFLYDILESDNIITIINKNNSAPRVKGLSLELEVPSNFSVSLKTYFGKKIDVSDVHGDIEIEGYYTDVSVRNISQDAVISTNQGDLQAYFDEILPEGIYFLSNYKGKTEIYLPVRAEATLLMDNHFGNYKSEFNLGLVTDSSNKPAGDFIKRSINGGGVEIKLINYFKNIEIKKNRP